MRIPLDQIPDHGLDVNASRDDAWAARAAQVALGAPPETVTVAVQLTVVADCIRVAGEASATALRDCDRCLAPIRVEIGGDVDLYYAPPQKGAAEESGVEEGDLDIGWFDGAALELDAVLSEQLALWLPDRVRCSDDVATRIGEDGPCRTPDHDGGPELERDNPFAAIRLPD